MPDYSKGKIYAIRAPGTDAVYIGSTTLNLNQRMATHRCTHKAGTISCTSKSLLDMSGAYIELIEEYSCENKEQLNRREGEIIRESHNAINHYIAGRTRREYDMERSKESIERHKETTDIWREEHRDQYLKCKREWAAKSGYDKRPEVLARKRELYALRKLTQPPLQS